MNLSVCGDSSRGHFTHNLFNPIKAPLAFVSQSSDRQESGFIARYELVTIKQYNAQSPMGQTISSSHELLIGFKKVDIAQALPAG